MFFGAEGSVDVAYLSRLPRPSDHFQLGLQSPDEAILDLHHSAHRAVRLVLSGFPGDALGHGLRLASLVLCKSLSVSDSTEKNVQKGPRGKGRGKVRVEGR